MLRRRTTAALTAIFLAGGMLVSGPATASSPAPVAVIDSAGTRTALTGDVVLAWKAVDGAGKYLVELSNSPQFTTLLASAETSQLRWAPTTPLWGAYNGQDFYWRVTPQGVASNTSAQSVHSFTRSTGPVAQLSTPAAGASIAYPNAVTLSWSAVEGANGYTLEYGAPGAAPTTVSNVTTTSYTLPALTPGAYEWNVVVDGRSSDVRRFTVTPGIAQPTLQSPAEMTAVNDVQLEWGAVPGARKYLLELSKDPNFSLIERKAEVSGTTYIATDPLPSTTYHWRVTAIDVNGQLSSASDPRAFRKVMSDSAESLPGNTAVTARPSFLTGSTDVSKAPRLKFDEFELKWTPVPRATYYEVTVNRNGRKPVVCKTASTSATILVRMESTGNQRDNHTEGKDCLWTSADADQIKPTDTTDGSDLYIARVKAVNLAASSTIKYQAANSEAVDVVGSEISEPTYFYVAPGTKTATDVVVPDASFPAETTEVSPTLRWSPVAGATGYEVEVYTDAAFSSLVGRFYSPTPIMRSNGVFDRNRTAGSDDAYYALINPAAPKKLSDSTWPELITEQPKASRALKWRRVGPVPTKGSVAQSGGAQVLKMTPIATSQLSGAARGYQVRVFAKGSSAASATLLVDQPMTVAAKSFGKSGNTITSSALPNGAYEFTWAVLDPAGRPGPESERTEFKIGGVAPKGLKSTPTPDGTGVTLTWNFDVAASDYVVSYRDAQSSRSSTVTTTARGVTLSGLAPGRNYVWSVAAKDSDGVMSDPSEEARFTTSEAKVALVTPTNTDLAPDKLVLTWKPVAGASRYKVTITDTSSRSIWTTQTSLTLPATQKLAYGTQYSWKVEAAGTKQEVFATSPLQTFRTLTAPGKPGRPTAKVDGTTVDVTWRALTGTEAGSAVVPSYVLRYRVATATNDGSWTITGPLTNRLSHQLSGLAKGTEYEFQVAARNPHGMGAWSDAVKARTVSAPGLPTNIKVNPEYRGLRVSWSAPARTDVSGAASGYTIKYRTGSSAWVTRSVTSTSVSLAGLAPNARYDVQISAHNAAGSGPVASASAMTLGLATSALSVKAKRGDRVITVTWAPPARNGGSAITGYIVQTRAYSKGKWSGWSSRASAAATARNAKITGLVNGTKYEVRVLAKNKFGNAPASAGAVATPAGKPLAPGKVKASSSKKKTVKVSWSKASANGSALKTYVVQYSTNGKKWKTLKSVKASKTSFTWKKAKSKSKYQFRVFAKNALGSGAKSSAAKVVAK